MTSEGPKSTEGHGIVRTGTSPVERPQGTRGGPSPNESHTSNYKMINSSHVIRRTDMSGIKHLNFKAGDGAGSFLKC